jgi:phenylacetate-CoA ligase
VDSPAFLDHDYFPAHALRWRRAELDEVGRWQAQALRRHVRHAARSAFYGERLQRLGCDPDALASVDDLRALPLTARSDLETAGPALYATPPAAFADLALTSGTTGEPVVVPYTARDLERLAFNEQVAFWGAGVRPGDRVLVCVTLDRCFVAGLAYYSGLVRLGAAAIRSGFGQPARQWELIRRLKPVGIVGVPSFLVELARWGEVNGCDPRAAGIRRIVTIGEAVRTQDHALSPMGQALADLWGASVHASYASTELQTCFCECGSTCGGHVHPELALVEIVDEAGTVLPAGEPGEVVVTPLGVEGLPLLRFRTGDVSRLFVEPCPCGWTSPRLGPIEGRLAHRLKYRGTTLYPEAVLRVLHGMAEVQAAYLEVRSASDLSDDLTVVVGSDSRGVTADQVAERLQASLRVRPHVVVKGQAEVVATMELPGERKPRRFFDLRNSAH